MCVRTHLQVSNFNKLPALLQLARRSLGELMSAFEFMDAASLHVLHQLNPASLTRCVVCMLCVCVLCVCMCVCMCVVCLCVSEHAYDMKTIG
jgi:hypothetical protein